MPLEKSPGRGTTGASAALPACRSDRRMCIVGGRNDATGIMRQFCLGCNLYLKINHELREPGKGVLCAHAEVQLRTGLQ